MAAADCFVCDPSILPAGTRCATGYPICDAHLEEITGGKGATRRTESDEPVERPAP